MNGRVFHVHEMVEFHPERPVKKMLVSSEALRSALICFRAGQALGEHAAPGEALIQVLSGRVAFSADGDAHEARPGTIFHLPAGVRHSVRALTDAVLQVAVAPSRS